MTGAQEFNPERDGWYFHNFSDDELSWDSYRETYLGINPAHDCEEAPLDCAFYELFKICAKKGNCGGMSLLAQAIFKYGGYIGFCSPAKFFTGGTTVHSGPDRPDLHKVLNILQARQFSASGIEYYLDVVAEGNLNDAEAAFKKVKELLGKGDYPVLVIATSYFAESAHTVIPYRFEEDSTGKKVMYIWDSNIPYNMYPDHYFSPNCQLVINSPTDWIYPGKYNTPYTGNGGSWCFAIPMSTILGKARQPMSLDMTIDALRTIIITGPGAAMSQISDDEGHSFYKTEADIHISRLDLETDPSKRLKGIGRWPWYAQGEGKELPELYFMRRYAGNTSALNFAMSSVESKMVDCMAGNLIEISSRSSTLSRDMIRISRLATATQSVEIKTSGDKRNINIRHLRTGAKEYDWRSFDIKNVNIARDIPIKIDMVGDMEAIQISSKDKEVDFELNIKQRLNAKVSTKTTGNMSTVSGEVLRVVPDDWSRLEKAKIKIETFKQRS